MSRIDEALRRSGLSCTMPTEELRVSSSALDRFPQGVDSGDQRPETMAHELADVAFKAAVGPAPTVTARNLRSHGTADVSQRLVTSAAIRPESAEQYRRLAATLHQAQLDHDVRSIVVTSALPGEGKTLTAANLALTLSESYRRRVLLIDADLRRPAAHDLFGVTSACGLTDVLEAEGDRQPALISLTHRLSLLPAGRPDDDPLGGLTSERMRRIVDEASSAYEWVIIDTPPVGLLPDANLLVSMVHGVLLVVKAGSTPYRHIERAVTALGRDRILGVVLNQARDEVLGAAGEYYRHYYYGDGVPNEAAADSRQVAPSLRG